MHPEIPLESEKNQVFLRLFKYGRAFQLLDQAVIGGLTWNPVGSCESTIMIEFDAIL
jgi:hypothetical protein